MDSVSESDSSQNNQLDEEFRQILSALKSRILMINNNNYLGHVRLWLEKLNRVAAAEKGRRNEYLIEFAEQIKNGNLKAPFTQVPPLGELAPLDVALNQDTPEYWLQDTGHCFQSEQTTNSSLPSPTYTSSQTLEVSFSESPSKEYSSYQELELPTSHTFSQASSEGNSYDVVPDFQPAPAKQLVGYPLHDTQNQLKTQQNSNSKQKLRKRFKNVQRKMVINRASKNTSYCLQQFLEEPLHRTIAPQDDSIQSSEATKGDNEITQTTSQDDSELPQIDYHNPVEDDSSWCDLAETTSVGTTSIMASGDTEQMKPSDGQVQQKDGDMLKDDAEVNGSADNKKINSMRNKIEGLQQKNNQLSQHVADYKKRLSTNQGSPTLDLQSLAGEVQALKDIVGVQNSVKQEGSFIGVNWKKNWEDLQLRLNESLNQNYELKSIIRNLERKLNDLEAYKSKEQNDFKKKINELHNKEIEMIKQIQVENLLNLETSYKKKIEDLEANYQKIIQDIQSANEARITEIKQDYQDLLREKDAEINRLDEIAQKQCVRMSAEVNSLKSQIEESMSNNNIDERIIFLHKCISKMDKLFKRSEKEYIRQIEKLKQELDLKDKSMQIQLRTQRAELKATSTEENQSHIDNIINELEARYVHMLEIQKNQAFADKKKNEQIIGDLKHILEKHDIGYFVTD